VASRVGPSAIYYGGFRAGVGPALATDLGHLNEDYAIDQARQLEGRADVHGEVTYGGDGSKATIDVLVVTPDSAWLIEVKSARATVASQQSFDAYTDLLKRDVGKGLSQLAVTADLIRSRHPALAALVPEGLPLVGSVITAEPIYQVNTADFRAVLPDPTIPTTILSLTEFEDVIGFALELPVAQVANALVESADGEANPRRALSRLRETLGRPPRNPLLDDAWEQGAWKTGPRIRS
jgi:hypothetical protein